MNPGLATILFGGAGYLLVYASVANHGRFALHPWLGLLADAYTGDTSTASSSSSSSPPAPSASSSTPSSAATAAELLTGSRSVVRNRLPLEVLA